MSEWDAMRFMQVAYWLLFLAPPALAVIRGAVLPTILAVVLSAIGIVTVRLSASTDLTFLARMISFSSVEYQPQSPLQVERLGLSFIIIGSTIWLGAMIVGLAGYVGGASWRR